MENKYYFIDKAKIVLAILVIVLHSGPNPSIEMICNVAVPLFFSFSGFFYSRSRTSWADFSKRILLLYAFWFAVQWPLALPMTKHMTSWADLAKQVAFSSTYPVSWYLIALVWSAILLTALKKMNIMWQGILLVGCTLYVMCVAELGWHEFFRGTWLHTFNGMYKTVFRNIAWSFPQGFIFFAMGYYMRGDKSSRFYMLFSLGAAVLYFLEGYWVSHYHLCVGMSALFSMLPLVYGLTGLCLSQCSPTPYAERGKLLREISTILYLCHPVLMTIGLRFWGISGGMTRILFVLSTSVPLMFIYFKAREYKYLKWLKYAC